MKQSLFAAAALSLTISACGQHVVQQTQASPPGTVTPITLTPSQRTIVQREVRASLKDPNSAKFGTMAAGRETDGSITVCGLVNAKNSYGGYAGMSGFIGALVSGGTRFIVAGIDGSAGPVAIRLCREKGIPI